MPPAQKDKHHTTARKVLPAKCDSLNIRRCSTHSPMSTFSSLSASSSTPLRRASVTTTSSPALARKASVATPSISQTSISSPATKPLPTPKSPSPSTRREWIAPPGRYSPSQIPAPKFVTTERRKSVSPLPNTKPQHKSGRAISFPPPANLQMDKGNPGIQTSVSGAVELETRGTRRRSGIDSGRKRREDLRPQGLGLSFGDAGDAGNIVDGTVSMRERSEDTALLSASSSETFFTATTSLKGGKKLNDNDDDRDKQEKRDSLSPNSNTVEVSTPNTVTTAIVSPKHINRCNHTSHLSPPPPPPSILPPSPSLLHPYISGIHISPSCTSGSLTHRLTCGHLILTPSPEHCASNCCIAKTTFDTARLKAQGFVANVRGLDDVWGCPCCAVEEEEGDTEAKGKKCVGVSGREMLGKDKKDEMEKRKEMVKVKVDLDTKVLLFHQSRQQKTG